MDRTKGIHRIINLSDLPDIPLIQATVASSNATSINILNRIFLDPEQINKEVYQESLFLTIQENNKDVFNAVTKGIKDAQQTTTTLINRQEVFMTQIFNATKQILSKSDKETKDQLKKIMIDIQQSTESQVDISEYLMNELYRVQKEMNKSYETHQTNQQIQLNAQNDFLQRLQNNLTTEMLSNYSEINRRINDIGFSFRDVDANLKFYWVSQMRAYMDNHQQLVTAIRDLGTSIQIFQNNTQARLDQISAQVNQRGF